MSNSPKRRSGRTKTPDINTKVTKKKKGNKNNNDKDVVEKDTELAVKPVNPMIDFFLGTCYIGLCLYLLYHLVHKERYMLTFFTISLIIVGFGINLVTFCSKYIAIFISSKLRSSKNIPKDCRTKTELTVKRGKFIICFN